MTIHQCPTCKQPGGRVFFQAVQPCDACHTRANRTEQAPTGDLYGHVLGGTVAGARLHWKTCFIFETPEPVWKLVAKHPNTGAARIRVIGASERTGMTEAEVLEILSQ